MTQEKILVVEDDQFLRELYDDVLKNEGYSVETAQDGEEALQKIKLGGWSILLLDIIIPKFDGLEVMRRARSENAIPPTTSVIFLTNLDKGEEIKTALSLGNGYLIKSQITPGSLVNEIKSLLEKRSPQAPGGVGSTGTAT